MQNDYLKFNSNGFSIKVESGKAYNYSLCPDNVNIYVDINASVLEIQDGSQTHPFSELRQAIAFAENKSNINVNIYLSEGDYGYQVTPLNSQFNRNLFMNKNNSINIYGNSNDRTKVKINGCWFRNANVVFHNLTIDSTYFHAIQTVNSTILLDNVLISSTETESTNTAITGTNSNIYCYNSRIEKTKNGIKLTDNSCINLCIFEFGELSGDYLQNNHNVIINTYQVTFDDLSQNRNFRNRFTPYPQPIRVYKNSDSSDYNTTQFNLNINMKNVNWMEIIYKDTNNNYNSTGKIYNPASKVIGLKSMNTDGVSFKCFSGKLTPDYTSDDTLCNLTLSNQKRVYIDTTNNNLSTNDGNYFHVSEIIVGMYNDILEV